MKRIFTLAVAVSLLSAVTAQEKKVYSTSGAEGAILSFSQVERNGNTLNSAGRFTAFFHAGTNLHYDFSEHAGLFTGINMKNIGIIHDDGINIRYKRRVYTVGVPVALKFGNLAQRNFGYIGAEANLAINYKEKQFISGDRAGKFNEWFSNRTPLFMPAVFAGVHTKNGVGLKFQYFLNNFLNPDFSANNVKPYAGMDAKVFYVTLGYDFDIIKDFKRKRK